MGKQWIKKRPAQCTKTAAKKMRNGVRSHLQGGFYELKSRILTESD